MIVSEIAAAAAPLRERLAGGYLPSSDEGNAEASERVAAKWAHLLSKDDSEALMRRLDLEGIDLAKATPLLAKVRLPEDASLPAWTWIFEDALAEAADMASEDWTSPSTTAKVGWRDFALPFIRVSRRRLIACAGDAATQLPQAAWIGLERALAERANNALYSVIDLDWSVSQAVFPGGPVPPNRSEFLSACYRDGSFFTTYPVAARLLSLLSEYWVEAVAELLTRLREDEEDICRTFPGLESPLRIESCTAALSDPHYRGRGVAILTFTSGAKLVYKPRSVGLEAAYFHFLSWLNQLDGITQEETMRTVRVLDRGDYGWMEWIDNEDCADEAEAALFYKRSGGMLALLYALAGADMHYENILAQGSQPVPIDLEVLMMPARVPPDSMFAQEAQAEASQILMRSVVTVGLLPQWTSHKKGELSDLGGLGAIRENVWTRHLPRLNGEFVPSHLHRDRIIEGFRAMYDVLHTHRDAILKEGGPLRHFAGLPVRLVNRATSIYARLLRKGCSSENLQSGVLRSIEFDILLKSALSIDGQWREDAFRTALSEITAMERGDIPFFQGMVDSKSLPLPELDEILPDFFSADGYAIAEQRLRGLSDDDLALQTRLIETSYDLMGGKYTMAASEEPPLSEQERIAFPSPSLRDEIVSLAREICDSSIRKNGKATWIAPRLIPGSEGFQIRVMSDGLYDGSLGVMLFLLAAAKNYGEADSGRVARMIHESFRSSLSKPFLCSIFRQEGMGVSGLGGQIYSLLLGARLSGDPAMIETAVTVGDLLDDSLITRDTAFDIISGSAGAIPSLLLLHRATGERRWLERAVSCGDHLLATRRDTPTGHKAWKCIGMFLSGYSHGAAGIAASLLRLHAASGEERFHEAAMNAVAYENTLFDAEAGNWRDIRMDGVGFMHAWCHGAPGITLGRIMGANPAHRHEDDIAHGVRATLARGHMPLDQSCCGNAGRADILILAANRLGKSEYIDSARDLMTQAISIAKARDGYVCYGRLPRSVRGPGFFQGLSGIGYTLARIEDPALPSVLAMEA